MPLEDAWREAVARVLSARGWPELSDTGRLGPLVMRLSQAYNYSESVPHELLPARLAFSFARDVPKGAACVRELVACGRLGFPEGKPLRVLDLGAGLGATTWGVARALEAAGQRGEIDATWIDTDAAALGVAADLATARGETPVAVRARTVAGGVSAPRGQKYDLVLLGQVLSELDATMPARDRVEKHADLVRTLLEGSVLDEGSLVVVEPALRDRTRHLHAVRDMLLETPSVTVFAPCLHREACPALKNEGDWCHEDLAVDLPSWLVPIARAAGLRWQGLTFSYLVLRKDGASLKGRGYPWRVISGAIVTKGKRELFLCGKEQAEPAARVRVQRLDRHASEQNRAWEGLARGDLVALKPPPALPLGKVLPETQVDVEEGWEY